MNQTGQCLCGSIKYETTGNPNVVAVCHCRDCQRSAGAPMVTWAMFPESSVKVIAGSPKTINSSGSAMRSFCPECGTGLFYRNADVLPGLIDVQTATLDNPDLLPPTVQIQVAERQAWVPHLDTLTTYDRFPSGDEE
jgi:hypothetical protein